MSCTNTCGIIQLDKTTWVTLWDTLELLTIRCIKIIIEMLL